MTGAQTILVVEDEANLLELYRLALERAGFTVFSASDGEAGYRLAQTETPGLVLLDIMMPKVDGYRMLRRLKKDPAIKDVPVIIFSNLSQKEEIEKGLKLGANDYIIKTSVTPTTLVAKVRQWMEN